MNTKLLNVLLAAISLPLVSTAAWTLQEDFEKGNTNNWTFWNQQAANPDVQTPDNLGVFTLVADPYGDASNTVVRLRAGDGLISDNAFRMTLPINPVIDEGTTGTFYFRFATEGGGINIALGLTNVETFTSTSDQRWGFYNALFRFGVPTQGKLQAYNSNGYLEADAREVVFQTWYEVWMTVHNRTNIDEQGNFTGLDDTYELHIKGGPWTEQTQLLTPDGKTEWIIRNNPTIDPLRHFMILPTTDSPNIFPGNDYFYVDDVYVLSGERNLQSPTASANWFGYPVDAGGNVDTGSFMGFLNVTLAAPWVWSFSLNNWLYIPDVTEGGAWAFVHRANP